MLLPGYGDTPVEDKRQMTEEMPEGWEKQTDEKEPDKEKTPPPGIPQEEEKFFASHKYILVVDDDPDIRQFIKTILAAQNCTVSEESEGRDLLRRVSEMQVDLILLDINMPGLDGIATLKTMRENVNMDREVPTIIMTAHGGRKDVVRAISAGAVDFIVKPFTPEILLEKLGKHLPK